MQAYSKTDLYNSYVQTQASEAFQESCITEQSNAKILQAHTSKLYTPNYFIRIAIGLLTMVAVIFTGLLLWFLSSATLTAGITILLIFMAVACYIALEAIVAIKQYYNAGIDNVLMTLFLVFTISGFFVADNDSWIVMSVIMSLLALWLAVRFTDAFMAVVSFCFALIFIFLVYIKLGNVAKATAPFLMMMLSALAYLVAKKIIKPGYFMYHKCFSAIVVVSLVIFYAAGNYFVVKQLSEQMFPLINANQHISFAYLFWIFIFFIPPLYIFFGVKRKDMMLIRTGLVLIAASVFTVKYYYKILPVEFEMLVGGAILIIASYLLIKYLKLPKNGFSDEHNSSKYELLNAEALLMAETFHQPVSSSVPGLYQGGSGGGGGATGDF